MEILNEDTPVMYVKSFIKEVLNGSTSIKDFNDKRINAEKNRPMLVLKDGHICQTREAGRFTQEAMEEAKKSKLPKEDLRYINRALNDYISRKTEAIRKYASVVSEESYFDY